MDPMLLTPAHYTYTFSTYQCPTCERVKRGPDMVKLMCRTGHDEQRMVRTGSDLTESADIDVKVRT